MKQRVATALVLAPAVLAVLFLASPWPIQVLGLCLAVIGSMEAGGLFEASSPVLLLGSFAYIGLLCAFDFLQAPRGAVAPASVVLSAIGVLAGYAARKPHGRFVSELASLWCAGPLAACCILHSMAETSGIWALRNPLLLALLPVWAGDVAAILVGQSFGKHPLAPGISPKKTVEGGVGNLLACLAVAGALAWLLGYSWVVGISVGLAAGVAGQAGDLFESYLKRQAGKKDSGDLLPGHGGILDRIDSLLFTAPAVLSILMLLRVRG